MVKTLVISVVLIAFAIIALGVKVLFTKNGRFPSGHAHEIEGRRRAALRNAARRKEEKTKH